MQQTTEQRKEHTDTQTDRHIDRQTAIIIENQVISNNLYNDS